MVDTSRDLELCLIDPRRLDDDQLIALHGIELPSHPNRAPQYICRAQCPRRSPMTRLKALIHFRTDRHWLLWQQHIRAEAKLGRFTTAHAHPSQGTRTAGEDGVVKGSKAKGSEAWTPGHAGHGRARRASASAACPTSSPFTSRDKRFDHGIGSSPLAEARTSLREAPLSTFTTPTPNLAPRRLLYRPTFQTDDDDDDEGDEKESDQIEHEPTPPETLAATEAYRHWSVVLGLASHEPPLASWVGPPRGASGGHELFQSWGWHVEELEAVKRRAVRAQGLQNDDFNTSTGSKRPLDVIPEGKTVGDPDAAGQDKPFKRPRGRPRKHSLKSNTMWTPTNRQDLELNPESRASPFTCRRNASDSGYESNLENEYYKGTPTGERKNSKLLVSPDVVHGALLGLVMMSKR
ncbi:BQ2448_4799 [Microbotryum intermedium]|uniref:BQ2448_4799 protein n=1 Tax=Microbotryum intermedium TaxID=269621 RepID=A0A238FFY9_9BASI|nr:BQ2448_4799 [Microbotryum intermedium]